MNMFIEREVVIIPIEQDNNLLITDRLYLTTDENGNLYNPFKNQSYNLYILSDDKIKENDFIYCTKENRIIKNQYHSNVPITYKKIIGTTDDRLKYGPYPELREDSYYNLPQPTDEFVKYYIEQYNKGNIITKVMVEYEQISEAPKMAFSHYTEEELKDFEDNPPKWIEKQVLKVNDDNTINIKSIKDTFSREEVEILIQKCFNHCISFGYNKNLNYKDWINNNL